MLVIGHRGAAGLAPENTLAALSAGRDAGADMLEFDVRLTKDGILVLAHDFHTLRTHRNTSVISQLTLVELQQRLGRTSITTLEEVLDRFFGKILLNIEAKGYGSGKAIVELLTARIKKPADWESVIVSSFAGRELSAARRASKEVNLALLQGENPFVFLLYQKLLRLTAVGFHRLYINPLALEIAKKLNLFTYAYTINRPDAAIRLSESGIDAVVTDYPDRIATRLAKEAISRA